MYTILNIVGLTAGTTVFLLLSVFVRYENNYDQFHEKRERIFRLQQNRYNQGKQALQTVKVCAAAGPSMQEHFHEVEYYVKLLYSPAVFNYKGKIHEEKNFYFAGKEFFRIFSYHLISGIDSTVLSRPNTLVISQSLAQKYFGKEEPIGKVVNFRGKFDLEITGVFADMPPNSHMNVDALASFATYENYAGVEMATTSWRWDNYYTYILLKEKSDFKELEKKLPQWIETQTGAWLKEMNQSMELRLQPLKDIHLHSNFSPEIGVNGNHQTVRYLSIISYFIIFMAWVNYINVSTARSQERAREIGMRKVLGSSRLQLLVQFLLESFLFNFLSLVISVVIALLLLPNFSQLCARTIGPQYFFGTGLWGNVFFILLGGTILSGLYPSIVLTGINPSLTVKGKGFYGSTGSIMRKTLVVFQFFSSITIIVCTYVIYRQVDFMRNQPLGFKPDHLIILHAPMITDSLYLNRQFQFKQYLSAIPQINGATMMSELPGEPIRAYSNGIRRLSDDPSDVNPFQVINIDEQFFTVMDIPLLAGRMYHDRKEMKSLNVVLNRAAIQQLGYKTPDEGIDQKIIFREDTVRIIGVGENYRHETLKHHISPTIYVFNPERVSFMPIRINGNMDRATLLKIEEAFTRAFPGNPFVQENFLDVYERSYQQDIQFGKITGVFSFFSILVTCLGLFGLSSYMIATRTKEIGIRKAMGASISNIIYLLVKDYLVLVLIGILLASPIAWQIMQNWLESFTERTSMEWSFIFVPSIIVIFLTLATIAIQTIRAAQLNPANTLKYE